MSRHHKEVDTIRRSLTPEQRSAEMNLTIDPGFVHFRMIQTMLGPDNMRIVDELLRSLPRMPDWQRAMRVAHIYKDVMLRICDIDDVPTLGALTAPNRGDLFCATVAVESAPELWTSTRVISNVILPSAETTQVVLHYSTKHFVADTLKSRLASGHDAIAVVAYLDRIDGEYWEFHPLLMGSPWLESKKSPDPFPGPEWYSLDFFEQFVEDIEEFAQVRNIPTPSDISVMANITESAFKVCLSEIIGDRPRSDWGGEMSDHFSAHLHLDSRPTTAAFVLKGPGNGFKPMTLKHLGKNSDQIFRLTQEPAQLLVVQHCHEITAPVRETLRVFAVQPGRPRRYCLIDGRDSLRLLIAYEKLDRALALSKDQR